MLSVSFAERWLRRILTLTWQQQGWLTMASPPIVPSILALVSIHRESSSMSVSVPLPSREREKIRLFPIQLNACWYTEWQSEIGLFGCLFSCVQHAPRNDMVTEHKRRSIKITVYLLHNLKLHRGEDAFWSMKWGKSVKNVKTLIAKYLQ